MSIERKDRSKIVHFNKVTSARLKYYIQGCKGVYLTPEIPWNGGPGNPALPPTEVCLEALNSRGQTAAGHINVPIVQIPELIEALIELRNENPV